MTVDREPFSLFSAAIITLSSNYFISAWAIFTSLDFRNVNFTSMEKVGSKVCFVLLLDKFVQKKTSFIKKIQFITQSFCCLKI